MKYLPYIAIIAALATQADSATMRNVSKDAANPSLMSSYTYTPNEDSIIYYGDGSSPTGDTLKDCYLAIDGTFADYPSIKASGSGGARENLHMVFDATKYGTSEISSSHGRPFDYNGGYYSLGFYLEAAEGSTGVYNATNATEIKFDLATPDATSNGTVLGYYGRVFSIGNGITMNITGKATVSGRFKGDTSKLISDSQFAVAGNLNVGGAFSADNTIVNVASTGVAQTGSLSLKDTELTVNGQLNSSSTAIVDGTTSIDGSGTINVISAATSSTTQTAFLVNSSSANVSIGKNVVLNVDSSANVGGNYRSFINNGTVILNGTINLTAKQLSNLTYAAMSYVGNMTVDGGTITDNTPNASISLIVSADKKLSVVNGGKVSVKSSSYLGFEGGTVETDSTAVLDVKRICFNTKSGNTLKLGSDKVLVGNQVILVRGSTTTPSADNKIELAADGNYALGSLQYLRLGDVSFTLNGSALNLSDVKSFAGSLTANIANGLIFNDFNNGLVKIDNLTSELISDTGVITLLSSNGYAQTLQLSGKDVNGNVLDNTKWSVDANGFLFNDFVVPEPAEWAAIFGALALAFAVYRRRSVR